MKAKLVGKKENFLMRSSFGFSTLELMIAFAIMSIVLAGAIGAHFASQYWGMTAETANEGLYKAKTKLEDLRSLVKEDFYQAVSTPSTASVDPSDPADASCIAGGLCYFVESVIKDLSSCSKYVEAKVEWQVPNYPTSATKLFTYLTNSPEIIARGGDCVLNEPAGDWQNNTPQNVGVLSFSPVGKQYTGIDVLHKKIYTTSNTIPSFLTYDIPTTVGQNPISSGSYDTKVLTVSKKLNSLDVAEDLATGRTYAYVAVNASTKQLEVIDVTDSSNPSLVVQRDLVNVSPTGSFPEGWRIIVYGSRLYMTTRETTGNEFHIFDISTPTIPTEIGTGFELNRTVNSMIVREQKVSGIPKKLVFLASDSNTKELGILDVTGDSITELNSADLTGIQDGLSLTLLGNDLYFGRGSNTSGAELYVFDITDPSANLLTKILGQAEVGADVNNIQVSGKYAFVGTNKSGEEFQVWNADFSTWTLGLNVGRFKYYNYSNLSLLGFDIDSNWIYMISQSLTSDKLGVIYAP